MRALADRWAQAADAEKVLDNPKHDQWLAAGKFAAEQGYGKPEQPLAVSGSATFEIVVRREGDAKPT